MAIFHNEHGDVVELRDTAGEIVNQYDYDIWGTPIRKDETVYNPFLYSGEYWDEAVALQYLRARWYDPSLGRFITEDTYEGQLNNPLTLNLYVYTGNNPLIYIDPSGNVWEFVGNTWRYVKDGVVVATDFLFMDDIRIITNPDSSFLEKAVAGASLLPQGKILKAGKVVKLGDDVVDTAKSVQTAGNRIFNVKKQESKVWKELDNVRGQDRKTSGTGRDKRYYEWDHTHNDIEVYNNKGKHLGSMDPVNGEIYKGPVKGRTINID